MKKKKLNKKLKAFTLLEMICVIAIIAALLLLFAPKLMNQKEDALSKNDQAVVQIVNEQFELAKLKDENSAWGNLANGYLNDTQLGQLKTGEYINDKQIESYKRARSK